MLRPSPPAPVHRLTRTLVPAMVLPWVPGPGCLSGGCAEGPAVSLNSRGHSVAPGDTASRVLWGEQGRPCLRQHRVCPLLLVKEGLTGKVVVQTWGPFLGEREPPTGGRQLMVLRPGKGLRKASASRVTRPR